MKKKNNLQIIIFMFFILVIPAIASYLFYTSVKKPLESTTVNTCDEVSIDSIKQKTVRDTVNFFNFEKQNLEKKIFEEESLINSQRRMIQDLKKYNDSLNIKLQLFRNKYRELKNKIEETKE